MGQTKGPTVKFDMDPPAASDTITRRGLIFVPGEYADKEYAMTAEEVAAAAADFQPVPLDVEHIPTIFDGKLGELKSVEAVDGGQKLIGEIVIPRWLHEVIGDTPIKVSTQWHKLTKRLEKLALVLDPRITEAAMMSAYVGFAGSRHSSADMADIQTIHDLTAKQGAKCALPNVKYSKTGEQMNESRFKKWWEWLTGEGDEAQFTTTASPIVGATLTANVPAVDPEKEAMRVRLAKLEADQIAASAAAFAEAEIAAHRAYPAERDALIVAFSQAAQDDAKHGAVTFAGGAQGSRVDALKALYATRPAHGLTTERLQPGQAQGAVVLNNAQQTPDPSKPKAMTQEEIDEFLALTPVGREALAARKNGGK